MSDKKRHEIYSAGMSTTMHYGSDVKPTVSIQSLGPGFENEYTVKIGFEGYAPYPSVTLFFTSFKDAEYFVGQCAGALSTAYADRREAKKPVVS